MPYNIIEYLETLKCK